MISEIVNRRKSTPNILFLTKNHMMNIIPHHVQLLIHIIEYLICSVLKNDFLIEPSSFVWYPEEPLGLPFCYSHAHSCFTIKHWVLWSHACVTVSMCKMRLHHSLYTVSIIMNNLPSCHRSEKQQTTWERVFKTEYFICYAWEFWKANKYFKNVWQLTTLIHKLAYVLFFLLH